jgi:hypothetical protein
MGTPQRTKPAVLEKKKGAEKMKGRGCFALIAALMITGASVAEEHWRDPQWAHHKCATGHWGKNAHWRNDPKWADDDSICGSLWRHEHPAEDR